MVFVVVAMNITISLLCWLMVFKIWQITKTLDHVAIALENAANATHNTLVNSPQAIAVARKSIANLNRNYQNGLNNFNKLQQIVWILQLGFKLRTK